MILIALTGLAGAGKDSVADVLVTHAGFSKLAFADALRAEVANAFDLGDQYGLLTNRATKELPHPALALQNCKDIEALRVAYCLCGVIGPPATTAATMHAPRSPRQILQWWGTEYRRAQDRDYWVRKLTRTVMRLAAQGQRRIVITDCRFANEAAALRAQDGEVWQVVRPGLAPVEGGHASQTDGARLEPDAVIVNAGRIHGLAHQTLHTLQRLHGGVVLPAHALPEGWPGAGEQQPAGGV